MKKIIKSFLANFKWYRRRQGGKWYLVTLIDTGGGFHAPIEYWTKELSNLAEIKIIKEENWPKPHIDNQRITTVTKTVRQP